MKPGGNLTTVSDAENRAAVSAAEEVDAASSSSSGDDCGNEAEDSSEGSTAVSSPGRQASSDGDFFRLLKEGQPRAKLLAGARTAGFASCSALFCIDLLILGCGATM